MDKSIELGALQQLRYGLFVLFELSRKAIKPYHIILHSVNFSLCRLTGSSPAGGSNFNLLSNPQLRDMSKIVPPYVLRIEVQIPIECAQGRISSQPHDMLSAHP